jgi:hypothetical protein
MLGLGFNLGELTGSCNQLQITLIFSLAGVGSNFDLPLVTAITQQKSMLV